MAMTMSDRGVQVSCDGCRTPAHRGVKVVRWSSRAKAVAELFSRQWGWIATGSLQLCDRCLARRVCQARGHSWMAQREEKTRRPSPARCSRCETLQQPNEASAA